MKDEINLEPYRKAWQAEKARLEESAPQHTEQDILAMLAHHTPQRKKRLPLWFGSAAASVALLVGVAWLLWFRPSHSTISDYPMVAELRPTETENIPNTPPSVPDLTVSSSPSLLSSPSRQTSHPSILTEMLSFDMPSLDNLSEIPIVLSEDTQTVATLSKPFVESRAVERNPNQEPLQAFNDNTFYNSIDKQQSPKNLFNRTRRNVNLYKDHSRNTCISLSSGVSFAQENTARPLFGVEVSWETRSSSAIFANNQAAIYLLLDQPKSLVSTHYGYGLGCNLSNSLSLRLNLGAYLLFGDFDLGLRISTEADYHLTDDLRLSAGYQYYMPGIISGDGHHAAFLSLGYIIE